MKRKKKWAKCPACQTERDRTEMRAALAAMDALRRKSFSHYQELKVDVYDSSVYADFNWACDQCLEDKRAIAAHPSLQQYCWYPHFAYFDTLHTCRTCQESFTFTKREKRFWFEQLKFWIDAEPVNCVDCRKEIRQLKQENKTLSTVLRKKKEDMTPQELEAVITIYKKWGNADRMKYYQSVLRKG